MNKTVQFSRFSNNPWLSALLAACGGLIYLLQLIKFALAQESVLDEGAYLYKGYLFVSGQYSLYQPYGPWSNHMPLSFLIPGAVQYVFGAGIRTGRFFAIFLAMITLLGIWVLARRFGSRGWAVAAVWIIAFNPMLAKMYSTAVSQGLVIAMLTWMLVLILGKDRSLLQILLGSLLGGMIFLTRLNMTVVLPAAVIYIIWEHGKKAGFLSALVGGFTVVLGHAIYWPDILQLWTKLPREISPFLDTWRLPSEYEGTWQPNTSVEGRLLSFFQTIRFHFTVMVGVIGSWLLWPAKKTWKTTSHFRIAVFLSMLFLILLILHLWASLTGDYCVFCMPGYMGFFFVLGLLILIITSGSWRRKIRFPNQIFIAVSILIIAAGIGYSTFEDIGRILYDLPISGRLAQSAASDSVPLGAIFVNKFGFQESDLRRLLPIFFGFGSGVLLLFVSGVGYFLGHSSRSSEKLVYSYGTVSLITLITFGTLITPSKLLSGGYGSYDCPGENVILTYEAAGEHLDNTIPPGALVYWKGTLSAVPLLYLNDIQIFPPQINDGYSYLSRGEDLDRILRLGRWNDNLSRRWVRQADFILVEDRSYSGWLKDMIKERSYEELAPTPLTINCRDNSYIRIFRES